MPPFPSSFPPKREIIETFDFNDIASGSGIEVFYGADSTDSTSTKTYHLVTEQIEGKGGDVNRKEGFTNNLNTTINFDSSTFNLPRTINGIPSVAIPVAAWDESATGEAITITISSVKLIKVAVGGATTDLTTAINVGVIINEDPGGDGSIINVVPIVLMTNVTNKLIKKGEKIRLAITINTGGVHGGIAHSPSNKTIIIDPGSSDIAWADTRLSLQVPFRIES